MMRWSKTIFFVILATSLVLAAAAAGAQDKGQKEPAPPYSEPYPMGRVSITLKSVGAGVGVEWGDGILMYKGKEYTFKVKGVQAGTVGVAKAVAKGDVYNLFSIAEFPGRYTAAGAGVAVVKGKEGQIFRNDKNVQILLKAEEKGMKLDVGPEGFTIKLESVQ